MGMTTKSRPDGLPRNFMALSVLTRDLPRPPADGAGRGTAPPGWLDNASSLLDLLSIMKDEPAAPAARDISSRIAGRVRALRAGLAMTLDALAAKSGVSRSMISLVERGESSPTAVVLERIATGLGVALATLFDDPGAHPDPLSRPCDRTPWRDPQSGYVRCNISPASFPSPIRIVEVVLPAGASVAYETGARDADIHQQVWVQEGSIELALGAAAHRLSEGDCLAMRLDEPTTFRNRARRPARYVVVVSTGRSRAPRR